MKLGAMTFIGLLMLLNLMLYVWQQSYQQGYDTAMADAYLGLQDPGSYVQKLSGANDEKRGISH